MVSRASATDRWSPAPARGRGGVAGAVRPARSSARVWLASLPSGDPAASPEDVAAEAWLTAAGKIGEFSGSDDDFAGWLFTIARLVLNNRRRAAQRRRTDAHEPGSPDVAWGVTDSPEGEVVGQAETRRLLAMLSPREAEVIACLEVVGLDVAATARALEMSPTAVRVARHRALRRLREVLADAPTPSRGPSATARGRGGGLLLGFAERPRWTPSSADVPDGRDREGEKSWDTDSASSCWRWGSSSPRGHRQPRQRRPHDGRLDPVRRRRPGHRPHRCHHGLASPVDRRDAVRRRQPGVTERNDPPPAV